MSEWNEYPLSAIMDIVGGGTPKTTVPEYWNGSIYWLSVVDFNNGRKYVSSAEKTITDIGFKESSTKLLNIGDIIISARGTVGALAVLTKPMAFNQSCYGLRAKKGFVQNDFLYYLVKDSLREIGNHTYGAVFDTITRETFDNIYVDIPELREQQRIAEVLSSLDDKIDLLHRQNQTLEQLAETMFRQWFESDSEDESTVQDEFEVTMGQSPPGNSYNESGQGAVFYQGRTDFGFRFPTPRVYCTEPTRFAQEGDTLMSVRAPVGDLNYAEESCCIGRGLSAIRHKNKQIHKSYTYYVLKSLRDQFDIHDDNGTIFGSISKDELLALKCRKLQPSEVEVYNKRVGPIDDKVVLNCKQIKQLEQTRDTLLPKLMSGAVRVISS